MEHVVRIELCQSSDVYALKSSSGIRLLPYASISLPCTIYPYSLTLKASILPIDLQKTSTLLIDLETVPAPSPQDQAQKAL